MTENEQITEQELMNGYLAQTDNKAALDELQAEINTRKQGLFHSWATGFPILDTKLKGGFKGEQLIFLGAISSLGKTSFALQIATQVAEQGNDVLIFSLEMSKNELNAKTISRYMYQLSEKDKHLQKYALSTQDILNGDVGGLAMGQATDAQGKLFMQAFEKTKQISDNIRIFIGENDISVDKVRFLVDLHIKATKRRPFVILDYLQILQPSENARTTDKRLLTDYDTSTLKVISRDFHIPVMVISAFNRNSYLEPVSMGSFRESSGIEYSSDILLGMQYKGMDYEKAFYTDDKGKKHKGFESSQSHGMRIRELLENMDYDGANGLPLPIELKILKNRNGMKGTLYYTFQPSHNLYTETGEKLKENMTFSFDEPASSVVSSCDDDLGIV